MTHLENGKPHWSEAQVETLLEEFFRREMPPALRGPDPAPPRARRSPAPAAPQIETGKRRANSLAGLVMVGCSSLLMLMLAVRAWDDSQSPDSHRAAEATSGDPPASSPGEPDPVKALQHNGQGPVELRSQIRNVGAGEPPDSPTEKPEFPELDIEVYPPEQAPPEETIPNEPAAPEPRPMPEEIRQLPEGSML